MTALLSFHAPGFWLVVSLLCLLAVTVAQPFLPGRWRSLLLLAVWLGVPYLALISGGVSPRLMGLRYLDWGATFRLGAGILLAVIALAALARLMTAVAPGSTQPARTVNLSALLPMIGWSGAEEFHWCFWRGGLWELVLLAGAPLGVPAYWAVWLAALVNLPFVFALQPNGWLRIVKAAALMVTTVAFFYTGNFWLCWLIHTVMWGLLAPVVGVSSAQSQSRVTTKT